MMGMSIEIPLYRPETNEVLFVLRLNCDAAGQMLDGYLAREGEHCPENLLGYVGLLDVSHLMFVISQSDWLLTNSILLHLRDYDTDKPRYGVWFSRLDEQDDKGAFMTLLVDGEMVAMTMLNPIVIMTFEEIIRLANGGRDINTVGGVC